MSAKLLVSFQITEKQIGARCFWIMRIWMKLVFLVTHKFSLFYHLHIPRWKNIYNLKNKIQYHHYESKQCHQYHRQTLKFVRAFAIFFFIGNDYKFVNYFSSKWNKPFNLTIKWSLMRTDADLWSTSWIWY